MKRISVVLFVAFAFRVGAQDIDLLGTWAFDAQVVTSLNETAIAPWRTLYTSLDGGYGLAKTVIGEYDNLTTMEYPLLWEREATGKVKLIHKYGVEYMFIVPIPYISPVFGHPEIEHPPVYFVYLRKADAKDWNKAGIMSRKNE